MSKKTFLDIRNAVIEKLNKDVDRKLDLDRFILGSSFELRKERSKFNPMYYILGAIKRVRIDPKKMFISKLTRTAKGRGE